MSSYTSGWTWRDDATDEQVNDKKNEAAIERLYREISSAYESIHDRSDERGGESRDMALEAAYEDAGSDEAGEVAVAALKARWSDQAKGSWGTIEAVEQLLHARGARLKRPYEDWNEDEQRVRFAEESRFGSANY